MREHEQLQADVYRGRKLAHAIRGGLAVVLGSLSLLAEDANLTAVQRQSIGDALAEMDGIVANVEALHALVRALAPEQQA